MVLYEITIDLIKDWNDTVKEIFRGSGHPLPENMSDEEISIAYFMQTAQSEDEAVELSAANSERLRSLQQTISDNLENVIAQDIRSRTGYEGSQFSFKWVYNNGEHIIEERSSYRIPL